MRLLCRFLARPRACRNGLDAWSLGRLVAVLAATGGVTVGARAQQTSPDL
jgi:hypothetical protein